MIFLLRVRVVSLLLNSIVETFAPHSQKKENRSTFFQHRYILYNSCIPQSFEIILIISFT